MKTTDEDEQIKHCTDRVENSAVTRVKSVFFRLVLFALVWWVLVDGAADSWLIGLPVTVFSTLLSVLLLPPTSWSLLGIARFIPFFIWQSIRGGFDVASRAMHPKLPISPGLYDYPLQLPAGLPRVFMANVASLLPGTLSVELDVTHLRVHALDKTGAFAEQFSVLENKLALIFRCELTAVVSDETAL